MTKLYIGLMSGTSMDGIDVALVDVEQHILVAGLTYPYSPLARQMLEAISSKHLISLSEVGQLNILLGREFATATLALLAQTDKSKVIAIGSHGQTVCHDAGASLPYTLQLGCPQTIAELTGLPVVADFRVRDLLHGGRGAPFAPAYHHVLFAKLPKPLAIINIGGIANITYLHADGRVTGFDIGPGNCLLDAWIKRHKNLAYDHNGDWAKSGQICFPLLDILLTDPYFQRPQPKSIGKEYFDLTWLESKYSELSKLTPVDVQATFLALTTQSIAKVLQVEGIIVPHVLLCGGGAHNQELCKQLQAYLPEQIIQSTTSVGVDPDFIEAMMFAWLADQTLRKQPIDLTEITGGTKPSLLGVVAYPTFIGYKI